MKQLILLAPEIFLSGLALIILLGDAFSPKSGRIWIASAILGLFASLFWVGSFFINGVIMGAPALGVMPVNTSTGGWIQYNSLQGMVFIDSLSMIFKLMILFAVILVIWLSVDYWEYDQIPLGSYVSLLLLATVGMMLLVSSADFLMAVISLELLSITSFVLTGFVLSRRSSSEGAIKFFLVGTFSASLLLFGISYYYGYFGTTSVEPLLQFGGTGLKVDGMLSLTFVFLISGIGFKLAMVPFHMWAPDAYEGAPTPITAFLSVAPKVAAIGFLIRILSDHASLHLTGVLSVFAAITMTAGNLGALQQTNMKRLLAYSSIAQVGYILVALVAGGSLGIQATILYTFVYLFMNLGVFAVLILVSNQSRSDELPTFTGLSQRSISLALMMAILLLSLTGIPPLAGFVGKFTIFAAVLNHPEHLWLGIVAVLNSVISLYYYLRIVHQMFFCEPEPAVSNVHFSPLLLSGLVVAMGVTVVGGILPNQLLGWIRYLMTS